MVENKVKAVLDQLHEEMDECVMDLKDEFEDSADNEIEWDILEKLEGLIENYRSANEQEAEDISWEIAKVALALSIFSWKS